METNRLQHQIAELESLADRLKKASTLSEKLNLLNRSPEVHDYLAATPYLDACLAELPPESECAIKAVIALGQGELVFRGIDFRQEAVRRLQQMLATLLEVESFYKDIGGIVGYHLTLIKLIESKAAKEGQKRFLHPEGLDLTKDSPEVAKAVRWGIESLPQLGEIYPVGGAGDRLNLIEEGTGEPLPAAALQFCGYPLLEGLMRDLQAREYLYYKLFDHQEVTPVAMMTSEEKNNDLNIRAMCAAKKWFGRPPESFKLFKQPLVPVITEEGSWALAEPLRLILKPGGHGVLWKLAEEKGVFDWLKSQDRQQALIRQINNPVAGTDHGILALAGIGCHGKKAFGFASCPRLPKTAEGVDVLVEKEDAKGFSYCLTNIEYTEFESQGIEDRPRSAEDPYSVYPSNTNILFADLASVQQAAKEHPIPGMLVNMKTEITCLDNDGQSRQIAAGRLESTMQNIADVLIDQFPKQLNPEERGTKLKSFITYNTRRKTLSVTKSSYRPGAMLVGTPEGCLYESIANAVELLRDNCGMQVPDLQTPEDFLQQGPALILLYHPALGPLYRVIAQKLRGGRLERGAELQLEIAELDMDNLSLQGSLLIEAKAILGSEDVSGIIFYGPDGGKCTLRNVTVINRGVNRSVANIYWKNQIERQEELRIILHGNGEFLAQDVTFKGAHRIEVPDGHRMVAIQEGDKVGLHLETIQSPTWHWKYSFDEQDRIILNK